MACVIKLQSIISYLSGYEDQEGAENESYNWAEVALSRLSWPQTRLPARQSYIRGRNLQLWSRAA
ncbi:hypothetical protein CRG98_029595 [Punica granatum]|uniref:Uncharacterized protein n=1 Tax=Punica granatum TaxID=22663 RepID=A0A2I0J197_PUNGR|nr:hypothetical protein CRG98_029595 [Punica granatum]